MGRDDFLAAIGTNPVVVEILERGRELGLSDWYLTAGGLFQTVWNHVAGPILEPAYATTTFSTTTARTCPTNQRIVSYDMRKLCSPIWESTSRSATKPAFISGTKIASAHR